MNRYFKKAFTLTELLIALAIISIIAVMMMSISKKGMEDALNLYYYTGYKGMSDAIDYSMDRDNGVFNNTRIAEALGLDPTGITDEAFDVIFPEKNGIRYERHDSDADGESDPIKIIMRIPSANGRTSVQLFYTKNSGNGLLVPGDATLPDGTVIPLYARKDLLPFYIDDGEVGRVIQGINPNGNGVNNNNQPDAPTYGSFHNRYCTMPANFRVNTEEDIEMIGTINGLINSGDPLSCNDVDGDNNALGILKVVNPKKIY